MLEDRRRAIRTTLKSIDDKLRAVQASAVLPFRRHAPPTSSRKMIEHA